MDNSFIPYATCKTCIYRPVRNDRPYGANVYGDERICPFISDDPYMSHMPPDNFFCMNAASVPIIPPMNIITGERLEEYEVVPL